MNIYTDKAKNQARVQKMWRFAINNFDPKKKEIQFNSFICVKLGLVSIFYLQSLIIINFTSICLTFGTCNL